MILELIGTIIFALAIAVLVRSVWRMIYDYPHISEKRTWETYRLLTDASTSERLDFFVEETKMTHMLFPRNLSCKGSHAELNLPRYDSVLLSGDVFFLEHLLQKGCYQSSFLVSHEIGRPMEYPCDRNKQKASVDLNEIIKHCPQHRDLFYPLLAGFLKRLEELETAVEGVDVVTELQHLFDRSFGLCGPLPAGSESGSRQLLSAFRSELELWSKASARQAYNGLLPYYLWGEERSKPHPEGIRQRLVALSEEIAKSCRGSSAEGTLFRYIVSSGKYNSSQVCDAVHLLCENADRLAATVVWFISEVLANPMYIRGLQKDVDQFLSQHDDGSLPASIFAEKIKDMQYFNNCILEVLRKWPTKANGVTVKIMDHLMFDGEVAVKGSEVLIPYFSLFRQLWIDRPEMYMPHRWHDSHHQYDMMKAAFGIVWSEDEQANPFQSSELSHLRLLLFQLMRHFELAIIAPGSPHGADVLTLKGMRMRLDRRGQRQPGAGAASEQGLPAEGDSAK